jgi:hypothetical protein
VSDRLRDALTTTGPVTTVETERDAVEHAGDTDRPLPVHWAWDWEPLCGAETLGVAVAADRPVTCPECIRLLGAG